MNFQVGEAFDFGEQLANGPMVFFWGQGEVTEPRPGREIQWPNEPTSKLSWLERRRGFRHWKILLRLQPPAGESLDEWGSRAAAAAGVSFTARAERKPEEGDTAVWFPAIGKGRNAAEAMAGAGALLSRLQCFEVAALQVQVELFGEAA
jgi:hypothetical protein